MNALIRRMILVAWAAGVPAGSLAVGVGECEWMRPLDGAVVVGQIYRIEVPPDVMGRSHRFPTDMRIIDAEGRQWPFYLESMEERTVYQSIATESINQAWVEGAEPYARVDLHIKDPPTGHPRYRHSQVTMRTTGRDFIRRVEVLGSDDQVSWASLGKGFLIEVREPRPISESTVYYPVSDYPFVQIRVYPNARNANERFTVNNPGLFMDVTAERPGRPVALKQLETPKADRVADANVVLVDLQHDHQPVRYVRLRGGRGDYFRRVVIYVRNDEKGAWRYAGSGDIHRIGSSVKDQVRVNVSGRFLKCELYHYDDAPLELESIEVVSARPFLLVEALHDRPAVLYYGSPFVDSPRYDLQARLAQQAAPVQDTLSLGEPLRNPAAKRQGYGSWGPWLAGAAIGLASLAIILVIVRMFKRTMPA